MADQVDVPATAQESGASVEDRLVQFFAKTPSKASKPPQQQAEAEPPVEEVSQPEEPEAEASDTEQSEEQPPEQVSDEPPEGTVELEHLGRKYFVPPDLKEAFEANRAQATRSTQELAPVRKAIEIEKLALQAAKAAEGETRELATQKAQLESYREQAKKLDWSQLTLDQKVDLDRELRSVNERLAELDNQMSAKRSEVERRFGELVVNAVQETEKYMAHKVTGWNEEKGKALHKYGSELGIPAEKLTAGWFADPVATHIMWKAQQWDSLQASKPSVSNRAAVAHPVVKPGSSAVQKSVQQSNYQKARVDLKKTGSLDAFAEALLAGSKGR